MISISLPYIRTLVIWNLSIADLPTQRLGTCSGLLVFIIQIFILGGRLGRWRLIGKTINLLLPCLLEEQRALRRFQKSISLVAKGNGSRWTKAKVLVHFNALDNGGVITTEKAKEK